ncbi:MAG: hypothetical protein J0L93_00890 [Deltaproteobacteria bacterium]|nr:hypothetical protein [Deltaproteobacteria bacterium]
MRSFQLLLLLVAFLILRISAFAQEESSAYSYAKIIDLIGNEHLKMSRGNPAFENLNPRIYGIPYEVSDEKGQKISGVAVSTMDATYFIPANVDQNSKEKFIQFEASDKTKIFVRLEYIDLQDTLYSTTGTSFSGSGEYEKANPQKLAGDQLDKFSEFLKSKTLERFSSMTRILDTEMKKFEASYFDGVIPAKQPAFDLKAREAAARSGFDRLKIDFALRIQQASEVANAMHKDPEFVAKIEEQKMEILNKNYPLKYINDQIDTDPNPVIYKATEIQQSKPDCAASNLKK